MKFKMLIMLVVLVSQNLQGQAICSKHLPKVFFGPDNVIFGQSDPSEFYMIEISDAIDSLHQLIKLNDGTNQDKSGIMEDIKALQGINQDWINYSKSTTYHLKSDSIIEVKDFFYVKEIENRKAMNIRGGHFGNRNCLYSNPNDCLFYGRIKKWKIKIEDDFGNAFMPDYHSFSNIGMEGYNGSIVFYRKRKLNVLLE